MYTIFNALPDGRMMVFDSDARVFYKMFPEELKALQASGNRVALSGYTNFLSDFLSGFNGRFGNGYISFAELRRFEEMQSKLGIPELKLVEKGYVSGRWLVYNIRNVTVLACLSFGTNINSMYLFVMIYNTDGEIWVKSFDLCRSMFKKYMIETNGVEFSYRYDGLVHLEAIIYEGANPVRVHYAFSSLFEHINVVNDLSR